MIKYRFFEVQRHNGMNLSRIVKRDTLLEFKVCPDLSASAKTNTPFKLKSPYWGKRTEYYQSSNTLIFYRSVMFKVDIRLCSLS